MTLRSYAVFHYVLDWKVYSDREMFVAEEKQQQEQHQALQMGVSIKQEATEQQQAVYQQHVEFMEKLLDKLKEGTVYGSPA